MNSALKVTTTTGQEVTNIFVVFEPGEWRRYKFNSATGDLIYYKDSEGFMFNTPELLANNWSIIKPLPPIARLEWVNL